MKLAVIIDPIESLNPSKDSSIAMLRAADELGLALYCTTISDMASQAGKAYAKLAKLKVSADDECWYQVLETSYMDLGEFDIIIMRKDPPFDMRYIYATYLLELAEKSGALVANKPQSLRDANEKFFTQHFPQCSPDTLVSSSIEQLSKFWQERKNVVFKPLDGMGGRAIFHIDEQGKNLSVALELLTEQGTLPAMAQAYIPEIKTSGDKRILIIGDSVIPYGLARIPQGNDSRGNLAAGAKGEVVKLTQRDYYLCQQIIPTLKEKGLHFVGIDVIGDYITEINVTSPTCIQEISAASQLPIARQLIEYLVALVKAA